MESKWQLEKTVHYCTYTSTRDYFVKIKIYSIVNKPQKKFSDILLAKYYINEELEGFSPFALRAQDKKTSSSSLMKYY